MTDDEIIDFALNHLEDNQTSYGYVLFTAIAKKVTTNVVPNQQERQRINKILKRMEGLNMIKIHPRISPTNDHYDMDKFGYAVLSDGGWLKHLELQRPAFTQPITHIHTMNDNRREQNIRVGNVREGSNITFGDQSPLTTTSINQQPTASKINVRKIGTIIGIIGIIIASIWYVWDIYFRSGQNPNP